MAIPAPIFQCALSIMMMMMIFSHLLPQPPTHGGGGLLLFCGPSPRPRHRYSLPGTPLLLLDSGGRVEQDVAPSSSADKLSRGKDESRMVEIEAPADPYIWLYVYMYI